MSAVSSLQRMAGQSKAATSTASAARPAAAPTDVVNAEHPEFRQVFDQFVGETLYGEMLKSMRRTVGKPAYFYGGQAEEIFTQQLDQMLAGKLSHATAQQISQPMFELYNLQRK